MAKKKFGLGLAIGAVVDAVAGVLAAPKSGEETRKDLHKKAKDLKEVALEKTNEAVDVAEDTLEDVKGKASEVNDNLKKVAAEVQKRALNTVDGAKKGFNKKV